MDFDISPTTMNKIAYWLFKDIKFTNGKEHKPNASKA